MYIAAATKTGRSFICPARAPYRVTQGSTKHTLHCHVFLHLQNFQDQVLQWLQRRFSISAAQAATLPRVYVYGQHVDDATYPRLYASCDCVVLPTR
jgi:hypothetical protein